MKEKIIKKIIKDSVEELIQEELESYGIKREDRGWGWFPLHRKEIITGPWDKSTDKIDKLVKHLGLEYYKKEIKETNGIERNYTKEGFRKIKKKACKKNRK